MIVIAMNASYNSTLTSKSPTVAWKKVVIEKCLTTHLLFSNKPTKNYEIGKFEEQNDHAVLRLLPLLILSN